jgi:hypothetical protein
MDVQVGARRLARGSDTRISGSFPATWCVNLGGYSWRKESTAVVMGAQTGNKSRTWGCINSLNKYNFVEWAHFIIIIIIIIMKASVV